jgi:hypothetical protein
LQLVAALQTHFTAWSTPSVKLIGQTLADFSAPNEIQYPSSECGEGVAMSKKSFFPASYLGVNLG